MEVTNHEGQSQQKHLHAIACHLGIFLAINVNVMEVGSIHSGQQDHGGFHHHCSEAIRPSFPHFLDSCSSYQRLPFAIDNVRTQQDLGVAMEHSRHDLISGKAQIPAIYMFNSVHTCTYLYLYTYYQLLVLSVLRGRHEEREEGHQKPCIAWDSEQPVPQTLLHFLRVLYTPNQLVFLIQQLVARCIQLLHHRDLCHPAVLTLCKMSIGQLIVWTPARCTRP